MQSPKAIFVYGTLQRGCELHHYIEDARPSAIVAARIPGRLYRVDWYPGLRPAEADELVHGEIVRVEDLSRLLKVLDEVEECHSDPRLAMYVRVVERVYETGEPVWVYRYNQPVTEAQLIQSGRWPPVMP